MQPMWFGFGDYGVRPVLLEGCCVGGVLTFRRIVRNGVSHRTLNSLRPVSLDGMGSLAPTAASVQYEVWLGRRLVR